MSGIFGKIAADIYGSSVAEDVPCDPETLRMVVAAVTEAANRGMLLGAIVRLIFMDMIVLSDGAGRFDMTAGRQAKLTNVPASWVAAGQAKLSDPDTSSRSRDHNGRRIVQLHGPRREGWTVVNKPFYSMLGREGHRRPRGLDDGGLSTNIDVDEIVDVDKGTSGRTDFVRPPDEVQRSFPGQSAEAVARSFAEMSEGLFNERWEKYPRKEKRSRALRYWHSRVRSMRDVAEFDLALENYLPHAKEIARTRGEQFVMIGASFFGCWEDYVEFKAPDMRTAEEARMSRELNVGTNVGAGGTPEPVQDQHARYQEHKRASERWIARHGRPVPARPTGAWTRQDHEKQQEYAKSLDDFRASVGLGWSDWRALEDEFAVND